MTGKDFVKRTIKGEKFSRSPALFFHHFPQDCMYGENAVKAHMTFFEETDIDLCKVMNDNLVPSCPGIYRAADYMKIPAYSNDAEFIQREKQLVSRVREEIGNDRYLLMTIQGVCASVGHPLRPQYMPLADIRKLTHECYLEDPQTMIEASRRAAMTQIAMIEELAEAGADGVFYAVLGGEKNLFSRDEFELWQAPFDKMVMKRAKELGLDVILHMCKKDVDLGRFESYAPYCDAVNWGIHENDIPLEEGMKHFPGKVVLGGLDNRSGSIICTGSREEITDEVLSIRRRMKEKGYTFILGPDCSLPADIENWRIRTAVDAAHTEI
ncbi:MAG: hypothetical protein IJ831_08305 [Spirochaetales bacterium]|nr:hypothetical protein [Spirochaetales bacterium]